MDVDPVELMLQVFVFHVGHVVDHLQDDKPREHRQHKPLLGHTNTRVRTKVSPAISVNKRCCSHQAITLQPPGW